MEKRLVKIGAAVAGAVSFLTFGLIPAFAVGEKVTLCPPAGQPQPPGCGVEVSIAKIVSSGLNIVMFAAFIAALVFLIIGGIKWVMSGGDKEATNKAKDTVTSALIGLAVILGAWILIGILLNFFGVQGGLGGLTAPKLEF